MTPPKAIAIPKICIQVSGMRVMLHVRMLTKTTLKLMIAETGPVGPSFKASTTKVSARTKKTPEGRAIDTTYESKKRRKGTSIVPNADRIMTKKALEASA